MGIKHYIAYNDGKASYAERAIRTIKNKLIKYMKNKDTYKWVDVLPSITSSYNNTRHSSIDIEPINVNTKNTSKIFKLQYEKINADELKKADDRDRIWKNSEHLQVGDLVRVSKIKGPFTKDYEPKLSEELFKIHNDTIRDGIRVFLIKDLKQVQKIEGGLKTGQYFEIEKVIRKRKSPNGGKEFLVKFRHYPAKFNDWVNEKDMKKLRNN